MSAVQECVILHQAPAAAGLRGPNMMPSTHSVVGLQVVDLLLEHRLPEVLADELDDL